MATPVQKTFRTNVGQIRPGSITEMLGAEAGLAGRAIQYGPIPSLYEQSLKVTKGHSK